MWEAVGQGCSLQRDRRWPFQQAAVVGGSNVQLLADILRQDGAAPVTMPISALQVEAKAVIPVAVAMPFRIDAGAVDPVAPLLVSARAQPCTDSVYQVWVDFNISGWGFSRWFPGGRFGTGPPCLIGLERFDPRYYIFQIAYPQNGRGLLNYITNGASGS